MEGIAEMDAKKTKNPPSKRHRFSRDDDNIIKHLYEVQRIRSWKEISHSLACKTAKQCKERYYNYLRPGVRNDEWTKEEDSLLRAKIMELGFQWTMIAKFLPSRGANNIKNRWHKILCNEGWAENVSTKPPVKNQTARLVINQAESPNDLQESDFLGLSEFQDYIEFSDFNDDPVMQADFCFNSWQAP
jgi:hypothetical protein